MEASRVGKKISEAIGLGDLNKDNFKRMGGVDGVVSLFIYFSVAKENMADFYQNGKYRSAGELVGTLSEHASHELGIPPGIALGSGVIDAYAGWIGTVGAKVDLGSAHLQDGVEESDVSQAFSRLAAVAGTSRCHLVMSKEPVLTVSGDLTETCFYPAFGWLRVDSPPLVNF